MACTYTITESTTYPKHNLISNVETLQTPYLCISAPDKGMVPNGLLKDSSRTVPVPVDSREAEAKNEVGKQQDFGSGEVPTAQTSRALAVQTYMAHVQEAFTRASMGVSEQAANEWVRAHRSPFCF